MTSGPSVVYINNSEVATILEVEVAWAMVLSSYEIMPFIGSLVEYPRMVLEYTFNWNH